MTCVESEFGRTGCTVFGDFASSLRPKERIRSAFVARMEIRLASEPGYRSSVEVLNEILHRSGDNEIKLMTLRDGIESAAARIDSHVDSHAERVLRDGGFDPETGLPTDPDSLPEPIRTPKCPGEDGLPDRADALREIIDAYNAKRVGAARIADAGPVEAVEPIADNCVYISVDDVGVKHQKDTRKDGGTKTRKNVENTVIHVECAEGTYVLTRVGMDPAFKLLLAFLLENRLMENQRVVFFSDGAQNIRRAIDRYFAFRPRTLMLDWYHLEKRMRELCSMALKGTRTEKHAMRDKLNAMLWAGNVDSAMAYLRNMQSSQVKNAGKLKEAIDYLERKRPWICCYALRKELGLRNSSNPAEKENDLVVARRQKHNGMSWSFGGSHALATVGAARRNDEIDGWLTDKDIRFTPKPKELTDSDEAA